MSESRGESVRQPGYFDEFKISRPDAEAMILAARVKAGWITEEDLQGEAELQDGDTEASDNDAEAPADVAKDSPADEEADKTADA